MNKTVTNQTLALRAFARLEGLDQEGLTWMLNYAEAWCLHNRIQHRGLDGSITSFDGAVILQVLQEFRSFCATNPVWLADHPSETAAQVVVPVEDSTSVIKLHPRENAEVAPQPDPASQGTEKSETEALREQVRTLQSYKDNWETTTALPPKAAAHYILKTYAADQVAEARKGYILQSDADESAQQFADKVKELQASQIDLLAAKKQSLALLEEIEELKTANQQSTGASTDADAETISRLEKENDRLQSLLDGAKAVAEMRIEEAQPKSAPEETEGSELDPEEPEAKVVPPKPKPKGTPNKSEGKPFNFEVFLRNLLFWVPLLLAYAILTYATVQTYTGKTEQWFLPLVAAIGITFIWRVALNAAWKIARKKFVKTGKS